jgi:hypothetical protein
MFISVQIIIEEIALLDLDTIAYAFDIESALDRCNPETHLYLLQ